MRSILSHNKVGLHRGLSTLIAVATLVILLGFTASQVLASGMSSARIAAMAGSATALAGGVDAARVNPANLGLTKYRTSGLEFIGLGANVSNNAFTLDEYNRYNGTFLTAQDKADILDKIPVEGLNFSLDAEGSAMSLALGSFAITTSAVAVADVNLNRDILELVFNGNTYADTIDLSGTYSEAVGYATLGFSYGRPVYTAGTRQLALGATFNYIRGFGIERVVKSEGLATTGEDGFFGSGEFAAQTAQGGSGYGVDIGAALQINDVYTTGIRISNVLSNIRWTDTPEEHGFFFNFDTMTIANMDDDYVVTEDYSNDIGAFSTKLPTVMNLGIARTTKHLQLALDWEQGFSRRAGASTRPRISTGAEYSLISFLPLRAGFSTGGNRNTAFSYGTGLRLIGFHLDVAGLSGSSLTPGSAKGTSFAVSCGLDF